MNDNANDDDKDKDKSHASIAQAPMPRLATWEERMAALSSAAPKPSTQTKEHTMPDLHDTIASAAAGPILEWFEYTTGDPKARDDKTVASELSYDIAARIVDAFELDMVEELLVDLIAKSDIWDRKELSDMFARLNGDMQR